jgi:biopolymer transport protein ExbD
MKRKKFNAINIVPFVDVMLVLLAIVITTTTLVSKKIIPVNLPTASTEENKFDKAVVITIKKEGKLYLDNTPVTMEQLKQKLTRLDKKTPLSINCDKAAPFNFFVSTLQLIKQEKLTNISIITQE